MLGWVADFFRAVWGLLYWNSRKTWFRLRKGRSPCPCQNPSDSGKAWETGCEPAQAYNRGARFRRVCPLLKPGADGLLRCSVDAPDVRPFWGRAILFFSASGIAAYGLSALLVFAGMRMIGYEVSPWTIAWPPAWSEIAPARSAYFFEKGRTAYENGRINEAILSLSLATEINPGNYAAGFMLARVTEAGQPELSNREYSRLMRDHPGQRPATAQAWYRALLARGDFGTIAELSADALQFDSSRSPPWLHALTYAVKRTGELGPLRRALDAPGITGDARAILSLEWIVQTGSALEAVGALQRPGGNLDTSYGAYYRVDRLLQLNAAHEARRLLQQTGRRMEDRERMKAQLQLATQLEPETRPVLLDQLLASTAQTAALELACAHLIRRPDGALARKVFEAADLLPIAEETFSTYTALLCLAGVHQDFDRFKEYSAALRRISGADFATLAAVEAFFQSSHLRSRRAEAILPILQPLPLEVSYALYDNLSASPPSR